MPRDDERQGSEEVEITDLMVAAGLREFLANRDFEHDFEVVGRIYTAMMAADPNYGRK